MELWLQKLYSQPSKTSKSTISTIFGMKTTSDNQTKDSNKPKKDPSIDDPLIPIRLDIEIEGRKYRENFCWNPEEVYFTPETFAKITVEDNDLPPAFEHEIISVIKKAISGYKDISAQQGQ